MEWQLSDHRSHRLDRSRRDREIMFVEYVCFFCIGIPLRVWVPFALGSLVSQPQTNYANLLFNLNGHERRDVNYVDS